jgi:hypothetical protein
VYGDAQAFKLAVIINPGAPIDEVGSFDLPRGTDMPLSATPASLTLR